MRPPVRLGVLLAVLAVLVASGPAVAEKRVDVDEQLRILERGQLPRLEIPDARYRMGVFAFEDPDATGLGNALAAILGREVLVRSDVGSIGVIRFEGGLSPPAGGGSSYFDKVEKVSTAQQVSLVLWGTVQRSGPTIRIQTYLQIPAATLERAFKWSVNLPGSSGGVRLVAHARPDRMLLQENELALETVPALLDAAGAVDALLQAPSEGTAVVARLPVGSVYWIDRHSGEWVHVDAGEHGSGWARVSGHCTGPCAALLQAARFAAGLLQFMDRRRIPEAPDTLTSDARALSEQIAALEQLDETAEQVRRNVLGKIEPWVSSDAGVAPPGGAAFANIRALAKAVLSSGRAQRPSAPMAAEDARNIAFELAEASLADPSNADVLNNLATLFAYAGDERRAALARRLAPATPTALQPQPAVGRGQRRD